MKKVLLIIAMLFCVSQTWATTFYVSSSYTGATSNGQLATPWKSLSNVQSNMSSFQPGDFILFKKDDVFAGTLTITRSGTSTLPITFGSYGAGTNRPKFTGNGSTAINYLIYASGRSWITIRDIEIIDLTLTDGGLTEESNIQRAITFELATSCKVISCKISRVGVAVYLVETLNCVIDDVESCFNKMIVNTNDGAPPGNDDDYGGNLLILEVTEGTQIINNYFHDSYAESYDYGLDGGAIEFNSTNTNCFIAYNTITNCLTLAEYGSNRSSSDVISNNTFVYNKFINNGALLYIHFTGGFAAITNTQKFYNNVIVENVVGPLNESFMFGASSGVTIPANTLILKNNVFQLSTGIDLAKSSGGWSGNGLVRENNVYKLSGGSALNFTAGSTDITTSATLWNSTTGSAVTWDYVPSPGSPLINAGQNLSLTRDFAGVAVDATPNIGAFETILGVGATSSSSTILCNGGTSTVTVSATGGTAPYTGTGTFTVSAGTYTYTVTDAASGSASTTITVTQPSVLTSTATPTNILINGGTGSITMSATAGGVSPYQYSLDGGAYQSGTTFNGVFAGAHTVTIRDLNNCTITRSVTLTQPAVLTSSNSAPPILCNGNQSTITVTASGGVSPYTGTGTFLRSAGSYTFNITDANGAATSTSVTLTQPTALTATVSSGTIVVSGGTTTITVTPVSGGVAPYTYRIGTGAYQSNNFFPSITAGVYSVTIKDANGCLLVKSITITQPGALVASSSANSVLCNGGTTTVTVNAVGGVGPYTGTGSFTRAAGTFTFTVTDANLATATTTITVSQPTILAGTATGGTILVSGGTTTITMSAVSGGISPYQYSLNGGTYQSGNIFSGVPAGSHTVTIRDANACTLNKAVTITQPSTLVASASGTNILCNGGTSTVTVSATGGVSPYTGTGTFTINAGTANYTVTDANGATSIATVTKTQPTAITGTLTSGTILINGGTTTLTISAAGGVSPYTYKLNSGSYQSGTTFTGVAAGTQTVTIKDANNCTLAKTLVVTQPAVLTASSTASSIACNGGTSTITVSVTGGVPPYTGTGNFTVAAGTYSYTVTDANGATSSITRTITQPAALTGSLSSGTILVSGGTTTITVTASGGTGSLVYSLNGGAYQSGNTFANTPAGVHTVNIKDANACIISRTITITQPSSLIAESTSGSITCNGGTTTVTVTATGGTGPYTGTGTFVVSAGSYSYTVTDAALATSTTSGTISEPSGISFAVTAGALQNAVDVTTATVNVTAGTAPYQYSLDGGTVYQLSNTFSNLSAGTYAITVKDANNCTKISTFKITQSAVITLKITAVKTNVTCRGAGNGTITVSAGGGIGPYTYKKGNGSYQPSGSFTNLRSGTYKMTVKDSRNVTAVTYVTVKGSSISCP